MVINTLSCEFRQENWDKFVTYCNEVVSSYPDDIMKELKKENIHDDIIIVLIYRLKSQAYDWLYNSVEGFGWKRPIDLLNHEDGIRALKEGLLRMQD